MAIIAESQIVKANEFFNVACKQYCIFAIGHIGKSEFPICAKKGRNSPDGREILLPASEQGYCEVGTVVAKDQNGNNNLLAPVTISQDGAVADGDGSLETSETRCYPAGDAGRATHSIQVTGKDHFDATTFIGLRPL